MRRSPPYFCDDNKKHLSTDLARVEAVRPGFMSPDVELLDFETTLVPGP